MSQRSDVRPGAGTQDAARECTALRQTLEDQLRNNSMREARNTVISILCLNPADEQALQARNLIEERLARPAARAVGELRQLRGHQCQVSAVALSPDGRFALSAGGQSGTSDVFRRSSADFSVRVWDVESGQELRKYPGHTGVVTAVGFLGNGNHVYSAGREGGVVVWDAETLQTVIRVGKRLPPVLTAVASKDGRKLFTATDDRVVRSWDVASGERITKYGGHSREIVGLAASPDGIRLVTASLSGSLRQWDVRSTEPILKFDGHRHGVLCVAFNSDGSRVISGGEDRTARVWDAETGDQIHVLLGHHEGVQAVGFSADGAYAVTAGDTTLRIWNLTDGREVACLKGHSDKVLALAVGLAGPQALTGSRDTTVRYWQLPSSGPTNSASARASAPTELRGDLSVRHWLDQICESRLLEPVLEKELLATFGTRITEPRELLNYLVERGGFTAYQLHQLGANQGLGLRVGDFILLHPLVEGGDIFKARRINTTEEIALQVVRPTQQPDADAARKFTSEIRTLSRLAHPNIVRLHDGGLDRGGCYVAMELIEGMDLAEKVRQDGPLPVARACHYVRQAALGLEHAYERGLTHRDLKPANLRLSVASAETIKILGWGWSTLRANASRHIALGRVQSDSESANTDYMAPEQVLDPASADIRADIYSLGCILFYLLVGRPPFEGSFAEKLQQHDARAPALRELEPSVPPALEAVVHKMLAKNPADRYRTPAAVAVTLLTFCKE
jgi:WD40 repeat protein